MERIAKQQGMSLVELLVAVGIFVVALAPLLSIFTQALKTSEHGHKRTIAVNLAREMQEEIRSRQFWEPDESDHPTLSGSKYFPTGTSAQTFGLEEGTFGSGDSRISKFDDVDDYNNWCRGEACDCTGITNGVCVDNSPLEDYEGTKLTGAGYGHYQGFTRRVEIYNIKASNGEPPEHRMILGAGDYKQEVPFNFYDFGNEAALANLRAQNGKTRLKVVKVTVTYTGPVTPNITYEDTALVVLPVSREND